MFMNVEDGSVIHSNSITDHERILLGVRQNGDRHPGITSGQYLFGFLLTLGSAALLGSALLGIGQDKDRPVGVTDAQYLLGFLLTLGAAALLGFLYPCTEAAFTKVANNITYSSVLQFQFCSAFASTLFCTLGMIISKDFSV
ncbi:hypothetical protein Sjap_012525 [Stephania japonica]|uniref:Uncharacterized protein n=1 Tax=Stephania japonica TaxID=461633 RepID=A0AAP0IW86_9MAGN